MIYKCLQVEELLVVYLVRGSSPKLRPLTKILSGSDFAGIVESVGRNCKSGVKSGDKIYGTCHGIDKRIGENGAFAEYVMVKDGNFARLVEGSMSFEEAATLGMSITIVGQALYTSLKLPLPTEPTQTPFPILISGGSTTIGTLAIQYAKLYVQTTPQDVDIILILINL